MNGQIVYILISSRSMQRQLIQTVYYTLCVGDAGLGGLYYY